MSGKKRKKGVVLVRMISAETGTFYVTKKSAKFPKKLEFKKYDPKIRKHVVFKENKIK